MESEAQHKLLAHLVRDRELARGRIRNPAQLHYCGLADFVLREGQFFEPRPLPVGIEHLEIRHCYQNSFQMALQEQFLYVEGYAVGSDVDLPVLHAWNLDRDGFVVDTTWNPHGRLYFGVILPLTAIPRERGRQYPIIDDWERGYPILRKRWEKERALKEALGELEPR